MQTAHKHSLDVPEGAEAGRVVAVAAAVPAALKRPAVDACVDVAPQHRIRRTSVMVKVDILRKRMNRFSPARENE